LIAFVSCIDDLIFVENSETADSAYKAWRQLAACCGWVIPDEKSPPPDFTFRALGALVHLASRSGECSSIRITVERMEKMVKVFDAIEKQGMLAPSLAGQIFGQLGFAGTQFHGKWGRAKTRPFVRRQYETGKFALNPQMLSSIAWWKKNLPLAPIRQIFVNDKSRHLVVSYSDGEGSDAGVGIAIWCPTIIGNRPWAGYIAVPPEVRQLWHAQHEHAVRSITLDSDLEFNDIIEIEGIGPLLILHNWGSVMKNSLWIHFIDNSSALGSLVKGSSTVNQQDIIVGKTWEYITTLNVLAWFDRVDSKSNPVDGLSRQDFSRSKNCNWVWKGIVFPKDLRGELKVAVAQLQTR